MAVVVTKFPSRNVYNSTSRWTAAHHPVSFELDRNDQTVSVAVKLNNTSLYILMTGNLPDEVEVGQTVSYIRPNGEVHDLVISGIGTTAMVFYNLSSVPVSNFEQGGVINYIDAYANYYVTAEVLSSDAANQGQLIGTARVAPSPTGQMSIEVHEFLQSKTTYQNDFEYNAINKAIVGEGARFYVIFQEFYNGQGRAKTVSPVCYWTNSAKQVGDVYGENMAEYVPTVDATRLDPDKAKFMTLFKSPTYFPNFPFSLSFIYSNNLTNLEVTREEETFNFNQQSVDTSSDELDLTQRFFTNRLMLKGNYPSEVNSLDVWLNTGAATDDNQVSDGTYSTGDLFEDVEVVIPRPNPGNVSEPIKRRK